jgi:hypothetical protein
MMVGYVSVSMEGDNAHIQNAFDYREKRDQNHHLPTDCTRFSKRLLLMPQLHYRNSGKFNTKNINMLLAGLIAMCSK